MFVVSHPEVLADDWLPPTPLGRESETREVVRRLDPPTPVAPPPWVVAVAGPSGTGTSTVARRAAREVADRLRAASGRPPRILPVRVATLRGSHGVATALLRQFDPGFEGRGFPTAEIVAGVLRRLRREARPAVVVFDDVAVGGPELGPLVRAFAEPNRFLPEGESGLPPLWTILAGSPEGLTTAVAGGGARLALGPFVRLDGYAEPTLRAIVRDRAERSLGAPVPEALVRAVVARAIADGGGARRAFEILRRELLGSSHGSDGRPSRKATVLVEPHLIEAIGQASRGALARLGEVRRWEETLARQVGLKPLPTTTLWRRIVRLERAGYVRREIRTGGPGGTLSLLRVLTPLEDWITTDRTGSRPIVGVGTCGAVPAG